MACKFGRVKTGPRKGKCRKRRVRGAAKKAVRKRKGAAFKGRKRNVVGSKAKGSGRYCLTKRFESGKSSTRCYKDWVGMHNAYVRSAYAKPGNAAAKKKLKSLMMYRRKSAA